MLTTFIKYYLLLNCMYWGLLGVLVLTGNWPVMSIGLSLATGEAIHVLDAIVQPFIVFMAFSAVVDVMDKQ